MKIASWFFSATNERVLLKAVACGRLLFVARTALFCQLLLAVAAIGKLGISKGFNGM